MGTLAVVTVNPAADSGSHLASCFERIEIDSFVLERPPKPLDHDIVHPAPFAIHRDLDVRLFQNSGERIAGKLAALIGVEDLGAPIVLKDLFQGSNAEIGILGIEPPPGENLAGCPVHDRQQIPKAAPHRDGGDVNIPDVIWIIDRQPPQQIRIDLVLRIRLRRILFLVDRRQPHQLHQSTDPLAADSVALTTQVPRYQPCSIVRRFKKLFVNQAHQFQIGRVLAGRFIVIGRATDK